jgi:hypothetical protein
LVDERFFQSQLWTPFFLNFNGMGLKKTVRRKFQQSTIALGPIHEPIQKHQFGALAGKTGKNGASIRDARPGYRQ